MSMLVLGAAERAEEGGALVGREDLAGLGEVVHLAVGLFAAGVKEGLRRLGENDALAPAGGHGRGARRGSGPCTVGMGGRREGWVEGRWVPAAW